MRYAFGIVLNQMAGTLQNVLDKSTSFKICNGLSARNVFLPLNWHGLAGPVLKTLYLASSGIITSILPAA